MSKIFSVLILFCFIMLSSNIAQNKPVKCDSLIEVFSRHYGCIAVEKMPMPEIPVTQIQNEFLEKIDTNIFFETVFVKMIIDTLGNVLCPFILKGNNNFIDTIALNYISKVKFSSAENRGRKFPIQISLPFQGRKRL